MEPLESRTLLSATPTDDSFRLAIFADSTEVEIPADLGVAANNSTQSLFTVDDSGEVYLDSSGGQKLGDLFDIWQNNAGLAGNRADAILTEDQLLSHIEDGTKTVQMFVNGQVSTAFEDYVVQDDDQIVLVYGDNPVVSLNTNYGPIVVELFADESPITVNNFLNYVNDGDYVNSFFHRSVENFIIQAGGFKTNTTTFTDTDQFSDVPADAQIQNEPGLHNVRGTIAMAKLDGLPNSATNQFFVNLKDNSSNLDNQNGGFTVFGQVLDMTTSDTIADLPITAASTIDTTISTSDASLYSSLPLGTGNQLVVIQSVTGQGEISGKKFLDENGDGTYDDGEDPLAGVTIYLDANNNGAYDSGETWTITDTNGSYRFEVPAGSYRVRSELNPGYIETLPAGLNSYQVAIGRATTDVNFGENLAAPSGIDLLATSDTGASDNDNLTRKNNADQTSVLQFLVSGVTVGAEVKLFADGTLIGSATTSTDEVTITTDGTHTLGDGLRNITAIQTLGGTSEASEALQITIDTTAPAGLTNEVPEIAQIDTPYSFNANSPEEGEVVYSLEGAPSGMTINASTGQIAWTPTASQTGPYDYQLHITDKAGNVASRDMSLTVLGAIPAYPDEYTVAEDTTLTVDVANGVLSNDDTTSGTLTVAVIDLPKHGNLTLYSDGSFVYQPFANFSGTDTFTYQAVDGLGSNSNKAEVTITVTPVNDAPVGVADAYTLTEDTTLTKTAATGVLANDTDLEGDTLTAVLVTQASHGTVTLEEDGSFSYVPNANYNGTDSFVYKANDGTADSGNVTVTLTITAVNDAPTVVADAYSVDEDSTLTVTAANGVLKNDTDVDSSSFTAVLVGNPSHGTVDLEPDGSFVYTPAANYFGTDTFTYKATDGSATSGTATVTITVNAKPDDPTASNDTYSVTNDGTSQLFDVLANDTSAPDDTQTLTITSVTQGSAGGTVTIENNKICYTPAAGKVGQETFTYTIKDTDNRTDTATVTVTNAAPSENAVSGFVYVDSDGDGVRDAGELGVPGVLITLTGTGTSGSTVRYTALTADDGSYKIENLPAGTYQVSERQPTAMGDGKDSSGVSGATVGNDVISNLVVSGNEIFGDNNFGEQGLLPRYISIRRFFASAPPMTEYLRDMVAAAEAGAGYASLAEAIRRGDTNFDDSDNQFPVAVADTYTVSEDTTLTVAAANGVLANDTDADGDTLTATVVTQPSHGTLTLNSNGSFTYKPNSNYSGSDSFTYQASDGLFDSTPATVTINVTAGNDAPVAVADSYTVNVGGTLTTTATTGVLANDTDADGNTLTATVVTQPAHGTLTLNTNGTFTYTPTAGYRGTDSFTYKANDGTTNSAEATVTIKVNAVPAAVNNSYSVNEDAVLTVTQANGVLANDTDADSDTLTAVVASQPTHGTLSMNPNGSFTYTPQANYHGTDTFTYKANDGTTDSAAATVTITINSINDAPVAVADSYTVNVGGTLTTTTTTGVLANDTDADGDTLTAAVVTQPTHGTLNFNPNGTFTYTPTAGYRGTDSFTYKANDGTTNSAEATVTIKVNAVPAAVNNSYSVNEDAVLTVTQANGVLANDTDADSDTLTAVVASQPTHGTLSMNPNGSFTYTPQANYHGTDTFTYKANDGTTDSAAATVTITINSINDAPLAVADSYTVNVGGTLTTTTTNGVLANDTDADGNALTAAVVTQPTHGTLTFNTNGTFTYTPTAGYRGTDSFTYKANDGNVNSAAATVTIKVNAVPVAAGDSFSVNEDAVLTVSVANGVLVNDTDADSDTLTPTVVTQPAHGTVSMNANGTFTYTPAANYHGTDSFTYKVNDGTADSADATVTITVAPVNDAPVAAADAYSVDEDNVLTVDAASGVLDNDSDVDSTTVTAAIVTLPAHGTLSLANDGSFTYTPAADYHGTDTFTYKANDGTAESAEATVTITVNSVNDVPSVNDDSYSVPVGGSLTVQASSGVAANDTDADGNSLTVSVATGPSNGQLTLNADGSFTYTPNASFHGTDTFTYTVNDGTVDSAVATVTIDVNTLANTVNDAYTIDEDGTLTVDAENGVLTNDSDVDGDTLSVALATGPSHGTLTLNTDGSFEYKPEADFHGTDTFTYVVNDGFGDSAAATVTITVSSINDVPVANDDSYSVPVGGTLTVQASSGVAANDTDADGDSLTVSVATGPSNGQLTLNADGSFTYTPNADFHGTDTFTYTVNDGTVDSAVATVTIDVNTLANTVNDAYTIAEDGTLTVDAENGVLTNDSDVDGDTLSVALATGPSHGTLTLNTDGSFEYKPEADFHGTDTFTYVVNDGFGNSAAATVTITVNPVNDAPVVADDSYDVTPNVVLSVDAASGVLANDSDADDDSLEVTLLQGPAHGTLLMNADGSFTYTPNQDYEGPDSFTYTVDDGTVDSLAATVSLTVGTQAADEALAGEEDWT